MILSGKIISTESYSNNGEYYEELAALLYLLLVAYFIKFSDIVLFDVTLLAWGAFALYATVRIKLDVLFFSAVVHGVFLFFYVVGNYFVVKHEELHYGSAVLSSLFLSSVVYGLISGEVRRFSKKSYYFFDKKVVLFVYFFLIIYWVFFIFGASKTLGAYVVKDYGGSNYLTTSDLLAMFSLALVASSRVQLVESIIYAVVTAVALVLLGSRSAMVLFVISYFISFGKLDFSKKTFLSFALLGLIAIGVWFILDSDSELFYRFRTIFEMDGGESGAGRSEFFGRYLDSIENNPACFFLGCPANPGEYVHNIFSVHQYFGIIASFFVIVLLVLAGYRLFFSKRPRFIGLFSFVFFQVIFFRTWLSLVFPVLMAILVFLAIGLKQGKDRKIIGFYR